MYTRMIHQEGTQTICVSSGRPVHAQPSSLEEVLLGKVQDALVADRQRVEEHGGRAAGRVPRSPTAALGDRARLPQAQEVLRLPFCG